LTAVLGAELINPIHTLPSPRASRQIKGWQRLAPTAPAQGEERRMVRVPWFGHAALAVAFFVIVSIPSVADDKKDKGTVVTLDGLSSRTPAEWKEETPSTNLRLAQFSLPKAKDDKADAELVIFKGFGGTAKENVDRWKKQFLPPKDKKIDDVAKVEELKIGDSKATYLDIEGTYLFKARPMDTKVEERPEYRMLAIQFEGPKEVYHIKLTGPAKTVEQYKKGFDEWVKGFK
jgi:hypothetical protein